VNANHEPPQSTTTTNNNNNNNAPLSIRRLSPHFVPLVLSNSAAARLSLRLGLQGPNHSASTACAAGAHSIGDAYRCIQYGDADIMLAGGSEACIDPMSMAGFCRLKALSTGFNHAPQQASRPFDNRRDGFVMGEGSGVLVLEELGHAQQRGATILAEVRGYGLTGDAHHVTAPDPEGRGAERAMRMALERSGMGVGEVDYVNAHATSTPLGDEIEAKVIERVVLGDAAAEGQQREKPLFVSSTKGAMGHLLGAAGAVEAVISVMSIVDGKIPPTANLPPEMGGDCWDHTGAWMQHVIREPLKTRVDVAVSNSFGFGGTNACLVFSSFQGDS